MKYLIWIAGFLSAAVVQASVADAGNAECVIKSWDKRHFELACDPREPKITMRTPAEWVKAGLKDKPPKAGNVVEFPITQDKLTAWLDMNKAAFAKADAAAGNTKTQGAR